MFGSNNTFGQSSNSPFGSPSGFGQPNTTNNNPFAAQPFGGSTSPFGSQPGGSPMFGGTSTGVFGAAATQSPTPAFGASSSPTFGSSVTSFGASSTPAFGSNSSSAFGQKPAFGGFGSNTAQASPFGSTFQQPQPAFGNNLFGSTQFGASSQPAFGASTTPAFGSTSTPAFGAASAPSFGATSTPAFGSTTPAFGSSGSAFGASTTPAFGSGGAFGVSNTPAFGTPGTTAFGASSAPSFGASSAPSFGASSAPSFSFGSSPTFGQSTSTFGTSTSPFGAQSSPYGAQATTPSFGSSGFGQSGFGSQRGGSRVAAYSQTPEVDSGTSQPTAGKLESISAMPVYKDKSHEELRWEDYQLGDKGGPSPAAQSTGGFGSTNTQSNPFATSSTFGQSSANPFSSTTPSNPFASKPSPFGTSGIGTPTTATFGSSPFGTSTTSNPFGSTSSATPSMFGSSAPAFGTNTSPSIFGSSSSTSFGQSPSLFGSGSASGTTQAFGSGLGFGNTQSSPLFQSTTPSLGQTNPSFGQNASSFGQNNTAFGQTNLFSTPSTGFGGNIFSSTPSLQSTSNSMGFGQTTPSLSTPFQAAQPAQPAGSFGFGNFGQAQSAGTSGFGGTPSIFGQSNFGQAPATQNTMVAQPVPVTNPFGTLPAMPQMSIGRSGTAPSVQYGISSLPVVDKPAPVRISSLLTSRHLSQSRIRLPARRYHPKNDGPKVPFFNDDEETPSIPKADALFIPRENPRALVIRPLEQWPPRTNSDRLSPLKDMSTPHNENEEPVENGIQQPYTVNSNNKPNGLENDSTKKNGDSHEAVTGHRAGEAAAIVYEHGASIESLMPKLRHPDYYTEPRMQELATKERAEPGFCRHVKDFVVGRRGFGSIRFIGETDVRGLDIESLVQFNNREVIVYMDETKKPPVGQGLNKPAEVTLLNIKCFDKKTGHQYTEGPKIDRYMDMLRKKAEDQGVKFVSYDPIKGEWKFRVSHFSTYSFGTEDEDNCYILCC